MENETIGPDPVPLGRETPTPEDMAAIQRGVRRYGLSGLVNRTEVTWCVVGGAGFGCAVKAEALHALREVMTRLGLYAQ